MTFALVIGADDETAKRLEAAIGHETMAFEAAAVQGEASASLRGLDPALFPDAFVLTSAIPLSISLAIAREVSSIRPDVDIVLVAEADKDVLVEAMRAGVRDVAPSLEDPGFLGGLRTRLDARRNAAAGSSQTAAPATSVPVDFTSRTITVLSPKGGVGKTSISTNLAVALAERSPMEVVLVDLDLQFGDVATVLDLKPTHTLEDAFSTAARDNLLLKTYLTVHPAGFFVLCGAESPAANDEVTAEQVTTLVRQLQDQFRYVLIDTAAGLNEATLGALEATDDALLVSTMDLACLRALRKEIELLTELELMPASRPVVLNFADKQSGLRVKDVEAMIGMPVDFVLPRAKEVPAASNKGVPLLVSARSGAFVKTVRAIATKIYERARAMEGKRGHKRLEVA